MKNFRKLFIWTNSIEFVVEIYNITNGFPSDERFGLISQLRRAGVSIPSNIAEGLSRSSKKEEALFLERAIGSAYEIETQLLIAERLDYSDGENIASLINMIKTQQAAMTNYRASLLKRNLTNALRLIISSVLISIFIYSMLP